jgi:hypothetical protein
MRRFLTLAALAILSIPLFVQVGAFGKSPKVSGGCALTLVSTFTATGTENQTCFAGLDATVKHWKIVVHGQFGDPFTVGTGGGLQLVLNDTFTGNSQGSRHFYFRSMPPGNEGDDSWLWSFVQVLPWGFAGTSDIDLYQDGGGTDGIGGWDMRGMSSFTNGGFLMRFLMYGVFDNPSLYAGITKMTFSSTNGTNFLAGATISVYSFSE